MYSLKKYSHAETVPGVGYVRLKFELGGPPVCWLGSLSKEDGKRIGYLHREYLQKECCLCLSDLPGLPQLVQLPSSTLPATSMPWAMHVASP